MRQAYHRIGLAFLGRRKELQRRRKLLLILFPMYQWLWSRCISDGETCLQVELFRAC